MYSNKIYNCKVKGETLSAAPVVTAYKYVSTNMQKFLQHSIVFAIDSETCIYNYGRGKMGFSHTCSKFFVIALRKSLLLHKRFNFISQHTDKRV